MKLPDMIFLRDEDIVARITGSHPIVTKLVPPADWYSDSSLVQPCSLDLHIGEIHIPSPKGPNSSESHSLSDGYCLPPGGTVVISTLEEVHIPTDLGGIAFPASGVAFRGILMTNPGHVDPGYSGPLKFTIINMGRESYPLTRGGIVCTLLLFKLSSGVKADWAQRASGRQGKPPMQRDINRLSHDFLDVDERATKKALHIVTTGGVIITIIMVLVTLSPIYFNKPDKSDINKLSNDVGELRIEVEKLKSVEDFDLLRSSLVAVSQKIKDMEVRLPQVTAITNVVPMTTTNKPPKTP